MDLFYFFSREWYHIKSVMKSVQIIKKYIEFISIEENQVLKGREYIYFILDF